MLIDGKKISQNILDSLKEQVGALGFAPKFCDVLVGQDPVSVQYVNLKASLAEKVGIKFRRAQLPETITTEQLVGEIKKINLEENMCGLIVQLPLPKILDKAAVLNAVDPTVDVDCTGEVNSEKFYSGKSFLQFPTAAAVWEILESLNMDFTGKKFIVLGQGQLVGRPVEYLLKQKGHSVESLDKNNPDLRNLIGQADVIVSAMGKPKYITGNLIKPGSVIIDAGASESEGGIVGDVDQESVENVAGFLSPVPGGVGPVTVAKLLENVLIVAKSRLKAHNGHS